ncbi:DMT family transporter [Roseateles aquatilis]|jgi:drug/metabolite transporter (DMT)-like permease|uniref:DMT family transporter n=1 Tax=Roseateles aquatilis TaxID=431061 RepID=UPI00192D197F|nr:DMT family transporter [Roseateles aquatilis]MBY0366331.1 DMT family transporter [Burkholderiaceae bacterium]
MDVNERARGMIEMVAAMMICGTIGWLVVVSGRPVTQVVLWRCVFGALVLLPICATKGYLRSGRMSWRQFAIAVAGGAALVANWLLLFSAYSKSSISIATTVYNTQPFMLVGLGALFLGERLTLAKLGWLSLSFCGMLLIVRTQSEPGAAQSNYLWGIALSLGAAFFYALVALFAKQLKGVPPHLIALVHVIVGVVVLSPLVLQGGWPAGALTWSTLATLGVIHTGLMYILLYGAIQRLPTHLTGALSFIYPIVAIVVDNVAFGHRLHLLQVIGAALILLAAAGMTLGWSLRRKAHEEKAIV